MHLKLPGFSYSACGPFTTHCERIQKCRKTGDSKNSHRNELHKAFFAHDAAYSVSKNLAKGTISDMILKTRLCVSVNAQLAKELHKPVIWVADLAEMESLSSKNKNVNCLLCIIDAFLLNMHGLNL